MPISNGDAANSAVHSLGRKPEFSDYTKALEVLKNDYADGDGLHIKDLLDSNKRGALTYNDFLVLPGYIGERHRANGVDSLRGTS